MEITRNRIILYMFIIATGIDFTLPWPVRRQKTSSNLDLPPKELDQSRFSRQVVQPKWLKVKHEPVVDPTVYVNEKALEEAALLRKTIQQTVDDGTYFVTGGEPHPVLTPISPPISPSISPPISPPNSPPNSPPTFPKIFPNILPPILPPMEPQQPFPTFVPEDVENSPHDLPPWYLRMQRLWQSWSQGLFKGLRS